jgi:fumarate hydratase subunit alpha
LLIGGIFVREISAETIKNAVKSLFIDSNYELPEDIYSKVKECKLTEKNPLAKNILGKVLENVAAAKEINVPICQDTGMAILFVKLGQDVHIINGNFNDAVNDGVRAAYKDGLLRKSVVADPLNRVNTKDNTPAIIHLEIVEGESIEITAVPKGFGSENMSKIYMLVPADGRKGVIDAVIQTVKEAGGNPCPPIVVGVGVGGDFEQSAILAKKALIREIGVPNQNPFYAKLEEDILSQINKLDIGPQGFGGETTALSVNVEYAPTHIAGLPVAVNIGCHVTRHKTIVL